MIARSTKPLSAPGWDGWNGKKNVTQENAVKVYFGVGYRYTWDDIATVYKDYGTMHVLKHKYWALTKSSTGRSMA